MVMTLMFVKRTDGNAMDPDGLVPRVVKRIHNSEDDISQFILSGANDNVYVVTGFNQKWWNVDLQKVSCDCNEWDLSGIPCIHAICAIAPINDRSRVLWTQ